MNLLKNILFQNFIVNQQNSEIYIYYKNITSRIIYFHLLKMKFDPYTDNTFYAMGYIDIKSFWLLSKEILLIEGVT